MQPQRTRDDLPPALGRLDRGRVREVVLPQLQRAWVARNAALVDVEDAGIGGVRGRRVLADLFAGTALGAQAVERNLPRDVGLEVRGLAAGAEDKVFVGGAFGD